MDKDLKKIYNNISVERSEKNIYRKKIIPYGNVDYSQIIYYKSEEEYLKDCLNLFNKIITKKEKLEGRKISEKVLKDELENYIFLKLLIEKKIKLENFDINNEKKEISKIINKYENSFKNYIEESYPLKKFKVYNIVHNIKISEKKEEFGIYTLYKTSENEEYLKEYLDFLTKNCQFLGQTILETKVEARDQESANEIAKEKNEMFVDITNFILPNYISVGKNYFREDRYSLAISDDGICQNTYNEFNISSNFDDIKKSPYFFKLFYLTEKKELSFVENKIKLSLHWYREFLHEKDVKNSLLKGMIALEGLVLTKKLGDEYGIQSYLKIIISIILEEKDNKKTTSKEIKKIYTKRSEIAHGEKSYIDKSDIKNLKRILYNIFEKFLIKDIYQNLTTEEKYNNFFKNLKLKEKKFNFLKIKFLLKKWWGL